jgi:hypothetical protein
VDGPPHSEEAVLGCFGGHWRRQAAGGHAAAREVLYFGFGERGLYIAARRQDGG